MRQITRNSKLAMRQWSPIKLPHSLLGVLMSAIHSGWWVNAQICPNNKQATSRTCCFRPACFNSAKRSSSRSAWLPAWLVGAPKPSRIGGAPLKCGFRRTNLYLAAKQAWGATLQCWHVRWQSARKAHHERTCEQSAPDIARTLLWQPIERVQSRTRNYQSITAKRADRLALHLSLIYILSSSVIRQQQQQQQQNQASSSKLTAFKFTCTLTCTSISWIFSECMQCCEAGGYLDQLKRR